MAEGIRKLSTALLGALITAGAALVVAIVGSVTSVLVSLRTSRAAIEQVRYERAHDRRDEVIATIYVYLYDLHDGLAELTRLTAARSSAPPSKVSDAMRLAEKVQEFQGYQRRHALWLSNRTSGELSWVAGIYATLAMEFAEVAKEHKPDSAPYREKAREIRHWVENDGLQALMVFHARFQAALGVEDEDSSVGELPPSFEDYRRTST